MASCLPLRGRRVASLRRPGWSARWATEGRRTGRLRVGGAARLRRGGAAAAAVLRTSRFPGGATCRVASSNVAHGSSRRGTAPVAQRIEHLTTDQKVRGSNPFGRALLVETTLQVRAPDRPHGPGLLRCPGSHRTHNEPRAGHTSGVLGHPRTVPVSTPAATSRHAFDAGDDGLALDHREDVIPCRGARAEVSVRRRPMRRR